VGSLALLILYYRWVSGGF